jgi:hypothetical protein
MVRCGRSSGHDVKLQLKTMPESAAEEMQKDVDNLETDSGAGS